MEEEFNLDEEFDLETLNEEESEIEFDDLAELDDEEEKYPEEIEEGEEEEEEGEDEDLEDDIIIDTEDDDEDSKIKQRKKKITLPIMTKYEITKVLAMRSQQIMNNSPVLVDVSDITPLTPYNIALKELKERKIPFKIKRPLMDNTYEIWSIKDFKRIFIK